MSKCTCKITELMANYTVVKSLFYFSENFIWSRLKVSYTLSI